MPSDDIAPTDDIAPIDDIARIEAALVTLVRRATDPRGNQQINALAGVDIERAPAVMLARIEELEPVRLSELAEVVGVEVSTASRQVAGLVDRGYVERSPEPDDRRASAHRLSPTGRDLRHRLGAARRVWFERLLADFDEVDRARLGELLERFVQRLVEESALVERP